MSSKALSKIFSVPFDVMTIIVNFLSTESIRNIIEDIKNPLRENMKHTVFPLDINTIRDFLLADEFENTQLIVGTELQMRIKETEEFFNYPYKGKTIHGKSKTLRLKNFVSRIRHADVIFNKLSDNDNELLRQIPSLNISNYSGDKFFTGTHTNLIFTKPASMARVVVENDMDTLDLSRITVQNVEMRAYVKNLILFNTCVNSAKNFGNVHTLDLETTYISDVSSLGNVHTLNLSNCINITDVSALEKVHTLNLSGCWSITDVSMLGGVHDLNISFIKPRGINRLGGVHKLNLTGCENLTNGDITELGGVYNLNLTGTSISNISSLHNVRILTLMNCSHIVDFSVLGNQDFLDLEETNISNVSHLGRVRTLRLNGCIKVSDVSALGDVDDLDISTCYNITNFSMLGNIRSLNISCTRVNDLSFIKTTHTLSICGCNIKDFSPLKNVKCLDLSGCNISPMKFPILESVTEIDISSTLMRYTHLLKMKNLRVVYDDKAMYIGTHEKMLLKAGIKMKQFSMRTEKLISKERELGLYR
jgi:hypothetical protein